MLVKVNEKVLNLDRVETIDIHTSMVVVTYPGQRIKFAEQKAMRALVWMLTSEGMSYIEKKKERVPDLLQVYQEAMAKQQERKGTDGSADTPKA
jgi:hypothetical protein